MGPEAILNFINPEEVIKRLAASQGIDVLNLVRSMEEIQQERQQQQAQEQDMALTQQASRFAQVDQQREAMAAQQPE